VARISDSDPEMLRYFQEVGIAPDARIEVVELRKFLGTVAVTVDDGAPLDLGDVAAQAIWVRS
ncbi:FeoA family protein, partial [Mycobacterium kansasii]